MDWPRRRYRPSGALGSRIASVVMPLCPTLPRLQWGIIAREHRPLTKRSQTYSALISVFEKGNQSERGLEVFEAMQRQGVVPDVITYNSLIDP